VFSLLENPDGTIQFLNRIRHILRDHHLRVTLRDIEKLGPEAIAAFIATMRHPEIVGSNVEGDYPADDTLRKVLEGSGFFEHVRRASPRGPSVGAGKMYQFEDDTKVIARVAMELTVFAMSQMSGKSVKHGPSYSLLMETMANTFDHASPNSMARQRWWTSVYYDHALQKACFTFVDHGVGILRSYTFLQRVKHFSGTFEHNGEKLQRLLLGQIPSRTKEKHRGRGLPKAYQAWQEGRVKNLVIIANNAYANAQRQEFKELSVSFDGTIVYWEI
jgi:hypothetical protein